MQEVSAEPELCAVPPEPPAASCPLSEDSEKSIPLAVHEIVNQALEKLEEMQVPMPDYALKSAGAAVIQSRTSPSLRTAKAKVFWYSLPVMDYMRSPELILETDNHPGNCWPFPGSQGHMFIKLSMPVILRAVTMAHVSGTAFHGESISGAPKDFAVYGSKEEHEEQETFLGQFTFLATRNPSQTFQLKGAVYGMLYLGYCIRNAESGMLNLRRCIWDAVFRMPYQGCRIWAAISGMPMLYLGYCILDAVSWMLILGCCIWDAVSWMLNLGCCISDAVSKMLYLGCCVLDADSGMLYLGCCIRDAVSRILYPGCCIRDAVSGMLYPGCCILDADSGMLYLGCCILDADSGMLYLGCCILDADSGMLYL
ncbi:hypothetical protein Q9233_014875 [Columba guinea]|nr:hypothetical protein Q9233_014875 [Columba guinea]